MFSRSAGFLATCCALGASAFLLPPDLATEGGNDIALPFVAVNPKHQILELPCSSCAFSAKQQEESVAETDATLWIQGGANNLMLNFTVSEDGQTLELNKHPIFPMEKSFEMSSDEWYIDQVAASTTREQLESGDFKAVPLRVTSYGTGVGQAHEMTTNGDEIITVKWQVFALENQAMTVKEVAIQLLRIENGELLILSAEPIDESMIEELPIRPGHPEHARPYHGEASHPQKDCKSLPAAICKFINAVEAKIEAAKIGTYGKNGKHGGCRRPHRLPGHIRPHLNFEGKDDAHHGRPHHMRPHGGPPGHRGHHGHHGHHHRHHHFAHSFIRGFIAILIPVMAGIFVGLSVSLVGLVVGRSIGWLWIRVVRGGKRGSYASVAQNEIDAEEGEAKDAPVYLEETEAPPVYEDALAYELSEKNNEN